MQALDIPGNKLKVGRCRSLSHLAAVALRRIAKEDEKAGTASECHSNQVNEFQ
jgi:hypothetical protein